MTSPRHDRLAEHAPALALVPGRRIGVHGAMWTGPYVIGPSGTLTSMSTADGTTGRATASAAPVVDWSSDRPAYKQIADHVHERLDAGEFRVGDRLPSLAELTQELGVSPSTVRAAMEVLIREGRAEEIRGRGFFVRQPHADRYVVIHDPKTMLRAARGPDRASVRNDVEAQGFDFRQVVDGSPGEVAAPPEVAAALDIDGGAQVFRRRRVVEIRSPGEQVWTRAALQDSYYPLDVVAPHMWQRDTSGTRGLHGGIADAGYPPTRFVERTSFRMPDPEESSRLDVASGIPVIERFRVAYCHHRAVECLVSISAGDRYKLEYHIEVP